jgi:uncharacterized membrane protein YhaH (DUF805 family)
VTFAQKLLGFRGRLSRLDWWLFAVGLNLVGAGLTALLGPLVAPVGSTIDGSLTAGREYVGIGVALLLLWPSLAVTVKRRHDRGAAGWTASALFVVLSTLNCLPLLYILLTVYGFEKGGWWGAAAGLFAPAVGWIGLLVFLGFLPGDAGPNRHGPSPLAPPSAPPSPA